MSEEIKGTFRDWWQVPRVYGVDPGHRQVTFLELFYDLVYVVIIAEIGHMLSKHLDIQGFIEYGFLFFLVWFAWLNGTLYHDYHGNNDVRTRFFTFLQMGTVVSMAIFAHSALEDGISIFFISYSLFLLILTYLWWRTGVHDPDHRPMSQPYSLAFFVASTVFGLSGLLPYAFRIYLWGIGLVLFLVVPFALLPVQLKMHEVIERDQLMSDSAVERFGLFSIIVVGEVVVGVVAGVTGNEHIDLSGYLMAALGLIIAFGIWWNYFDLISHHLPDKDIVKSYIWMILHWPLTMSIAAIGAIILHVVEHPSDHLNENVVYGLTISCSVFLLTSAVLAQLIQVETGNDTLYQRASISLVFVSIIIIFLAFLELSTLALFGIIVACFTIPYLYVLTIWIKLYREGIIARH